MEAYRRFTLAVDDHHNALAIREVLLHHAAYVIKLDVTLVGKLFPDLPPTPWILRVVTDDKRLLRDYRGDIFAWLNDGLRFDLELKNCITEVADVLKDRVRSVNEAVTMIWPNPTLIINKNSPGIHSLKRDMN